MTQNDALIIDDLSNPTLSEIQRQAINAAGDLGPGNPDIDQVLSAACAQTGLDNFGNEDFLERLALWLDCVREDRGLNALGRLSIIADCVRYASNRLKLEDLIQRHPAIRDEVIDRPIIVAGLPRSGTTHLVNMLAADQRLSAVPYWEMQEPVPAAGEPASPRASDDPRYQRAQLTWQQLDATLPLLKAMHPIDPEHIHEELELENLDFSSYNLEWLARAPRWRDYYLNHDQTPHYRYLYKVLQAIQWQRRQHREHSHRWVLKSPQHLEQFGPLYQTFPDATFALTHRDPAAVIVSIATMLCYGDRLRRHQVDTRAVAGYWTDRVERLLRSCVRDRASLPAARTVDIHFGDFMAAEMATLERIYQHTDLPLDANTRRQLARYQESHPRDRYGSIRYDLEGDFGLNTDSLRERFRFYSDYFDLPKP